MSPTPAAVNAVSLQVDDLVVLDDGDAGPGDVERLDGTRDQLVEGLGSRVGGVDGRNES
jgi:hypothetical protein